MDPISQAAFERRVRNRRLRAIAREERRLNRERMSNSTGNMRSLPQNSPPIANGFLPINSLRTTPLSAKTASPIKKTSSGCGSCRKRAKDFAEKTRQAKSNQPTIIDVGKRVKPAISLAGKSSQPRKTS